MQWYHEMIFFQPGMAYVASGRVTSIQGLRVLSFNPCVLYSNPKLDGEHMPILDVSEANLLSQCVIPTLDANKTTIHHNIQSLAKYFLDMKCDTEFHFADIIYLSETWQHSHHTDLFHPNSEPTTPVCNIRY